MSVPCSQHFEEVLLVVYSVRKTYPGSNGFHILMANIMVQVSNLFIVMYISAVLAIRIKVFVVLICSTATSQVLSVTVMPLGIYFKLKEV